MRSGYMGPLLLLTIGFILLFNNLGLLPWRIWGSLWHYWPVILILSGIQILAIHTSSRVVYILTVILSILLIAAVVFLAWNGYPEPGTTENDLSRSIFNNSRAGDNDFNFADLDNAKFNNSRLKGANLNFADLQYADLSYADLEGANINFVDLEGANMTGARIEGVNHAFAGTSSSTICPDSTN